MKTTYEAIIKGDKVTWIGERPETDDPIQAHIHITPGPISGATLAKVLAEIAASTGGVHSISDPVAWQREQRKDRPMPGREPRAASCSTAI